MRFRNIAPLLGLVLDDAICLADSFEFTIYDSTGPKKSTPV